MCSTCAALLRYMTLQQWWGKGAADTLRHAYRQHERMSVELLEDILGGEQSHTISRDLSEEEIKHIEAMITCEKGGQPAPSGKRWLYEVIPPGKSTNKFPGSTDVTGCMSNHLCKHASTYVRPWNIIRPHWSHIAPLP